MENTVTAAATEKVALFSKKFNINEIIAEILISRGIDTEEKAEEFLHSGKLYDPFLLTGMNEAAEKIKQHIARNSSIVLYGDYDADGICSVALLYLYFLSLKVNINWYIPEREEGYGINKDAVCFIVNEYKPDLIISVDCGVTAINEVAYIKNLGIDIIVTDHHNSSGNLPDCTVINPKISEEYPFKELCGAGVALKLVQALGGIEEASKYLDIVTIATVADSVILTGENRTIVKEGLKQLNLSRRNGLKLLCEVAGVNGELNTFSIAFGIVPRINAAGRIGEAKRAVALFYEQDEAVLTKLCAELNQANTERQLICDEIYKNIESCIKREGMLFSHSIIVIDETGHDGVSGIVASKLCDRYCRPSFVFCEFSGFLKGSGRSIDGIDIFDMLSSMSSLFEKFGGHSCAAGVTIKRENLSAFRKQADEYIKSRTNFLNFVKRNPFDYDITGKKIDSRFIKELNVFEPCGMGNRKPRFLCKAKSLNAVSLKKFPQHLSFKLFDTSFIAFNQGNRVDILNSGSENSLFIEFSQSEYRGKLYDKGYLKNFDINVNSCPDDNVNANTLLQLCCEGKGIPNIELYDTEKIGELLQNKLNYFGTLVVVFSKDTLDRLYKLYPILENLKLSVFFAGDGNNLSRVLLSPNVEFDANGYDTVIFADNPLSSTYVSRFCVNKLYLPRSNDFAYFSAYKYSMDREIFKNCYRMITDKDIIGKAYESVSECYYAVKNKTNTDITLTQFTICYMVFKELNFISVNSSKELVINYSAKAELEISSIYCKLKYLNSIYCTVK